jgi:hypothetical protein
MAVTEVVDLLVTVAFLVQSALLIWSGYALHRCSRTIRKQVELIDAQRDLLRRQHHLLANISPEAGWKWTEVTTNINNLPDEARIHLRVMLTELLQELHKKEH